MGNGETKTNEGREYKVSDPVADSECYPKVDTHVWNEFAGLAIEFGGYCDISAVDPYTGRRFWLSSAFRCDAHAAELDAAEPGTPAMAVYDKMVGCQDCHNISGLTAIRRLLDAMEQAGFPDNYRENPKDNKD